MAWSRQLCAWGFVFSAMASVAVAATTLSTKRSMAHLPEVPQPPLEMPADYRAAVTASAKRYADLYKTSKISAAINEARNGIALAQAAKRPRDEAEFVKAALYASWLMGDSDAGFDYGQKLLRFADQFDDDRLRSIAHRVIGTLYFQQQNTPKQREHTELALQYAIKAHDDPLRVSALNNLGNLIMSEGDLVRARQIHEEVLAYREANGYMWDAAGSLTNLGDVVERAGKLEEALAFQEKGLAIRIELDDRRGQVRSMAQVAGLLRKLGRLDEALARATEASRRAQTIGGNDLLNLVYTELALIQETKGDLAGALANERLATKAREKMAGEQARLRATEFDRRLALEQKEQAIERLNRDRAVQAAEIKLKEAEISRQQAELHASAFEASNARWQRVGLIGIIMIGLVGLLATVSRQRLKRAADQRILAETVAAKEAAEQANALKSRLIGIVSHDIRSPLSSVISLTEEMRDDPPPGGWDERIDIIEHQTQLVVAFAQDLLDATALESGGLKLNKSDVDLSEIARSALGHLGTRAAAKRQHLQLTPASNDEAHLQADANKLHQIITNLVSNALKYSPAGSTIKAEVRRQADTVTFSVSDEGPGVSPEEISRLFQPFAQLRAKPTAGESSHGLGLSIAHELVRLHGGTLRVEPAIPRGSVFIAEFPITL